MADEMQKLAVIPGIKVLLDPLSNIHIQNAWNGYDHDLGHKDIPPPNAVISFGNQFLSKNLVGYLRNGKPEIHCHVQKHMDLADPIGGIGHRVFAEPAAFLRWFVPKVLPAGIQAEAHITREDLPNGRSYWEDPEMVVAEILLSALPRGCVLHMANSTPVRYLLLYQQIVSESHILTYANRGTSGIDGCVSTACGMAAAWPDRGHVLIVGDMAMVYDSNALWNTYVADNLKIVVINNNGGGIFKRIRNGGAPLGMEQYFSPAPKVSFEHLAATFGLGYMALGPEEVNAQTLGDWFGQKEKGILEIRID
jgi:2-succinyl-5-enolpyruvyl-6-hydroxy-3-cyclohexene-1-carboxylate synthase